MRPRPVGLYKSDPYIKKVITANFTSLTNIHIFLLKKKIHIFWLKKKSFIWSSVLNVYMRAENI